MATRTDISPLGTDIRSLLDRLRWRIRIYIWIEGISLALLWLGATFWIGLAIDYLPVLVGASEMPRGARLVLLAIIGIVLALVLYRWVFRRAFTRMPDRSMAVLLERRFQRFHDALVTSVEMAEEPDHARGFNQEMLARTTRHAQSQTADVRVGEVFRFSPLMTKIALALAVIAPIGLLYVVNAGAVETWVNRLYLLRDQPWPRSTHVAVQGIQIQRAPSADGVISVSELIPFDENREIKVAKGTSVVLRAQADATKAIPEYCTVYYHTEENDHGSVNMQKLGRIRDDYQPFAFDGKPFRGILSSIAFDVRGNDHRVRDYHLKVVPSPAIVDTKLDCVFPQYMVDEALSLWLPRTIDLASGTQLPAGSRITVRARSNKDLSKIDIHDLQADETTTVNIDRDGSDPRQFSHLIEKLHGTLTLELTLHDTDGVVSDPAIRMVIAAVEDQPPVVQVNLRGIGSAVTPDVVIPTQGQIGDDYDVNETWFDVVVNDGEPRKYRFQLGDAGQVEAELDFRAERATEGGLELRPKDKVSVTVMASDKCDLQANPNVGSGDRYQLEVVTPDELLAALERRELGLRRRLEQIIDELSEMRDSVSRVKRSAGGTTGNAPEDSAPEQGAPEQGAPEQGAPEQGAPEQGAPEQGAPEQGAPAKIAPADAGEVAAGGNGADPAGAPAPAETAVERAQSLRALRTQRSLVQSQKSAQEVLGVAASFDDIRLELINNRVDTEDRKVRLKEQIADPLRLVGETMFPELDRQLEDLQQKLGDPAASDQAVDLAVQQSDNILLALDKVLQKMLELETFNELMNIVRSLIEDQEALIEKTKKERTSQARDLLK